MNIAVRCSDISYQKLENVDSFSYLDINIQPYSLFGDTMPVYLPNNMTRNVHIIPLKVIFSDDITWESTSEQIYELAEYEQQPNLNEGRNHLASSLWFRSFALPHLFLLSYAQISTFYIQQYTSPIHIHKANLRVWHMVTLYFRKSTLLWIYETLCKSLFINIIFEFMNMSANILTNTNIFAILFA